MKQNLTLVLMVCALGLSPGLRAESTVTQDDTLSMDEALSEDALSDHRGEGTVIGIDDINLNHADLDAYHANNSVSGISNTGNNYISGSAFNGANGMFDTIQNSGNNVLIQKATIVNITVE
jgi:hypothetical protein